ncbi:MAG: DUF177 domain-containing protein [Flavobacteriales bacterium]|nr:DUF177 domain-containing protein [Flavobacteriales bacterium]
MEKLKKYDISFSGLKIGNHTFEYKIEQSFFDLFNSEQDFSNADISALINLDKKSSLLEIDFKIDGFITVPCDITSNDFPLRITNNWKSLVKFSDYYDDSDDELIVLPLGEHYINVAKTLYEGILVAIPIKKVNPNAEQSENYTEIQKKLKDLLPEKDFKENDESKEIDSRWEKLKDLKNLN